LPVPFSAQVSAEFLRQICSGLAMGWLDREFRMKVQFRLILVTLGMMGVLALVFELERRPRLFANASSLGAILALEIVLACLWRFEKVFFPVTMACFLSADTAN